MGASGAGKSTLINLVMHLYEVDDGAILMDGVDIKEIGLEKFHSQIGVVLQENFLFTGTIFNNICFAKQDATYEEVVQAARFVCRCFNGCKSLSATRRAAEFADLGADLAGALYIPCQ